MAIFSGQARVVDSGHLRKSKSKGLTLRSLQKKGPTTLVPSIALNGRPKSLTIDSY